MRCCRDCWSAVRAIGKSWRTTQGKRWAMRSQRTPLPARRERERPAAFPPTAVRSAGRLKRGSPTPPCSDPGAAPGAALHVGPHLQQHGEVEARPAEVEGSVAPAAAALWRQPAPPPPHLRAPVKPRPFRPAQPISAFFSPSPRPRVFSQPIDVGSSPSNHVAWARCHRGARRGLVGARRRGAWPGGFIH
ncbi:protein lin-37 homolog isoform X18 [Gallus gallus]|uniref:protein lin-37 homolog isoform X18 n=1 Tax=Gallus gallus TaxID=9031 RepID=UPI001AE9A44A|nr:protein lin-37 homolog isoform X18 [Gallus gallus]